MPRTTPVLLLVLLLIPPSLSSANPLEDGDTPVDYCELARVKGTCRPAPLSSEDQMMEKRIPIGEIQVTRKLTLPDQPLQTSASACAAHFAISYFQSNDRIGVDTTVKNEDCVASRGEYELRIRTIDANGSSSTRTVAEQWVRSEPGDVSTTKFYSMNDATGLLWVRVNSNQKTACECD